MKTSTENGVSFVLRGDITLPLTEKTDLEATVLAWTESRLRVMAARTRNWDSPYSLMRFKQLQNDEALAPPQAAAS
ncbi:hypothetical protein Tco_0188688 [Tanacetum coccineum]